MKTEKTEKTENWVRSPFSVETVYISLMTTKIQKCVTSLVVRITKEILRELGWREGAVVSLAVEDGNLIISRYKKSSKSLFEGK